MNAPIHASAFAYKGAGCLILGESGAGKSSLVASALVHGATLIADDRLTLHSEGGVLYADAVPELKGVLELRQFGLVRCDKAVRAHPIHLVLELNPAAPIDRLPEQATREFCGITLPYLQHPTTPPPAISALLIYLHAVHEKRLLPTDWRPGQ